MGHGVVGVVLHILKAAFGRLAAACSQGDKEPCCGHYQWEVGMDSEVRHLTSEFPRPLQDITHTTGSPQPELRVGITWEALNMLNLGPAKSDPYSDIMGLGMAWILRISDFPLPPR